MSKKKKLDTTVTPEVFTMSPPTLRPKIMSNSVLDPEPLPFFKEGCTVKIETGFYKGYHGTIIRAHNAFKYVVVIPDMGKFLFDSSNLSLVN